MKKVFITLTVVAALVACGGSDSGPEQTSTGTDTASATGTTTTDQTATQPASTSLSDNPDYVKGLELEAKNDCKTCHALDTKLVGPAYRDIASKYANAADTTVSRLAEKIIKGGKGVWGEMVMTEHPNLSKEDATAMVKYILLLK